VEKEEKEERKNRAPKKEREKKNSGELTSSRAIASFINS
jgi:hypothetical protein